MKRIVGFVMLSVLLICAACDSKCDGYTIRGTAEGTVEGDTVFLCTMKGFFSFVPFDTAIVRNGEFEFRGKADEVSVCFVLPTHAGTNDGLGIVDVPFENSLIEVQIFAPETKKAPIVVNHGPDGPLWDEHQKLQSDWEARQDAPWQIVLNQSGTPEEIEQSVYRGPCGYRYCRLSFCRILSESSQRSNKGHTVEGVFSKESRRTSLS